MMISSAIRTAMPSQTPLKIDTEQLPQCILNWQLKSRGGSNQPGPSSHVLSRSTTAMQLTTLLCSPAAHKNALSLRSGANTMQTHNVLVDTSPRQHS